MQGGFSRMIRTCHIQRVMFACSDPVAHIGQGHGHDLLARHDDLLFAEPCYWSTSWT